MRFRFALFAVLLDSGCSGDKADETDDGGLTDVDLYTCALPPEVGHEEPGEGTFVSISVGRYGACALDADGNATCLGCADDDQPTATFAKLDLEYYHACGITPEGEGLCWAWGPEATGKDYAIAPEGVWADVSVGARHTCWLSPSGDINCFGYDFYGDTEVPEGGPWIAVSAGYQHTCAIDINHCPVCWGHNNAGETKPPNAVGCGEVEQVDAGYMVTMWLTDDAQAIRVGGMAEGEPQSNFNIPGDPWTQVSAGSEICALSAGSEGGGTYCTDFSSGCGNDSDTLSIDADTSSTASCVVLPDGSSSCWGVGYPHNETTDPDCLHGTLYSIFGL